ncbi:MFS transporter [Chloroflexota bacterium]
MTKEEQMTQQVEIKRPRFFYGYIVVALAFLANLILGGTQYTFGVFFNPLTSEFGWTRAATSGVFSLYMVLHGFLYIITGKLNDRFGPKIVMSGCGFFMGLGYLLMSRTSAIWHLYLFYGVVLAVGTSGGYVPLLSTVIRWFANSKKRGLMVGISVAGIGVGTMIMPPMASWLIFSYGWRTSYVVIGIMVFVLIILGAQFLRRAPAQTQQLPHSQNGVQEESSNLEVRGLSLQEAIHTRQFWLLCTAFFGFGIFLQTIMIHIVPHAIGLGISASVAANIFIAIGGPSVVGRIAMGSAADRIGNRAILIICFALMTATLAWLLVAKEMWMLYLFAGVFGFTYGGLVAAQSSVVADLFGISSHGVILGIIVFGVTTGGAVGPVLAGAIFDVTGSYNPAFLVCSAFSIAGTIMVLLLRPIGEGGTNG